LPAGFLRRAWLLAWSFGVIFQCYRRPKECPPPFAPTGWMALTYYVIFPNPHLDGGCPSSS
jgi:hypothetical protein